MSDAVEGSSRPQANTPEQLPGLLQKVLAAAQPGAVYGQPLTVGDYTIITASEVAGGGGFGSGWGKGPTPSRPGDRPTGAEGQSEGGGMGGGGGAMSRPVATIVIGPDGVKVKPVLDVTKIAIAAITAWGAMMVMIFKMGGKTR